jgi:hypothetical protein
MAWGAQVPRGTNVAAKILKVLSGSGQDLA